ncbi:hypothetical protein [Solirhodobacter olei]|uniref:hypothetical protein n=1 Tax=Solirhodobacter olei TaxID=2493082 RepID=UPI000FD74D68|nr:hypothetical protein [Solirhodobacter olei]
MAEGLTSTQRGRIAELHVATALMAQSGGRLSPFAPISDDHGVDLVVLDKESGRALPVQVKSWFLSLDRPVRNVQFDVQRSTFAEGGRGAVVCVVMDPMTLTMIVGWVFPMRDIPTIGTERAAKFALVPSLRVTTRDKYVIYRHTTLSALTAGIDNLLRSNP